MRLPRNVKLEPDRTGWNFYLCVRKDLRIGKGGEYLALVLQDASGQVAGRVFENVERLKDEFEAGEFVRVEGRSGIHNGELQLVITSLRRVHAAQDAGAGLPRRGLRAERAAADRRHVERAAGAGGRRRRWSAAGLPPSPPGRPRGGAARMAGGAADPPCLSRRVARARADDGPHRHGAGAHLRRARGRRAGRGDRPRHRQAAGAGLRQRRDQLHPRRQPGRAHRAGTGPGARHRPGHRRVPRRSAGRARAPGAVAPRQPRARITGRAEERRGLHPRRRRRARRPAPPGAAGAPGRGRRPGVHPVAQAPGPGAVSRHAG